MIVVDTNILIAYFLDTPSTSLAHKLYEWDPDWKVPCLWRHEFLNVLAVFEQQKLLSLSTCESIWRTAVEAMKPAEQENDMIAALEIATANRISAYDAQYIELAHRFGIRCVTQDKELLKKFPHIAISPADIVRPGGSPLMAHENRSVYSTRQKKKGG